MNVESVSIAVIDDSKRMRPLKEDVVSSLAESIKEVGLMCPIILNTPDDGITVRLVAGYHRLQAVKRLGWEEIDAVFIEADDIECQLAEIAENLHRADLTKAERAEQISRWIELVEKKQGAEAMARAEARNVERESDYKVDAEGVSAQLAQKPKGGRPEGGTSAAARELGVSKDQARRSKLIASIPDEAKQAAKDAGLDNNQSALERIAKSDNPAAEVKLIAGEKERANKKKTEPRKSPDQNELAQVEMKALKSAWSKARPSVREKFKEFIGAGDATEPR